MSTYEIYALCEPDTGAIRYIGKANNAAARLKTHIRGARRHDFPVYRWMNKLAGAGQLPVLRVLEVTSDWRNAERRLIALSRARGDRLLNVADGGDQPPSSPESCSLAAKAGARLREECPIKFTVHQVLRRLGYVVNALRDAGDAVAAEKLVSVSHRLGKLDQEDLFWRVFRTPSLHLLLPERVRDDARQHWSLV